MVAALLASVLNLIHETVKMDHLMAHRRGRISRRAIEELGADVDFILAVALALPNLLSRAVTISLRGRLNGDNRFRQRVVEVDAIQNVEQALELSHNVRHFHGLVVVDFWLSGLADLSLRLFVELPATVIACSSHDTRLSVRLVHGDGVNLAILLVNAHDQTDLVGLLVDNLLVSDNAHVFHYVCLLCNSQYFPTDNYILPCSVEKGSAQNCRDSANFSLQFYRFW